MRSYLKVNKQQIEASAAYRDECFYKIFPKTVYKRAEPKPGTLRWIYSRCADGRVCNSS